MTDELRRNAHLVEALGSALRQGGHAIGTVPALVRRVLAERSWRHFVTQLGDEVEHESFVAFVEAKPLRGLGADLALIRRVIADDTEALDLLDRALQEAERPVGSNQHSEPRDIDTRRVANRRGTSKEYALRRLRKDAPELHAKVLAGELSAHRAMVEGGFTPPRFTVRVSGPDEVVETLRRRLPPDVLAQVAQRLAE